MNFLDLPEGESVFIDANVFVYAFAADPTLGPPCRDLVERIGRKELEAYLSTSVFSEIAHRLMTLEACVAFGWPYPRSSAAQSLPTIGNGPCPRVSLPRQPDHLPLK